MNTKLTVVRGFLPRAVLKSALLSFFFLFALSLKASLAQNTGKEYLVTVNTMDNKSIKGTLISANEKGISIAKKGAETVLIEPSKVKSVKFRPRKNATTGLLIGAAAGLVTGTAIASILKPADATETVLSVVGTAALTFAGAAIGGSAGSRSKHVFEVNGRAEDYNQQLSAIKAFVR